jgi:heterogeneous nuclear ribonucleoprotein F/H
MDGIPLGIGLGGTMDPLEAILGPFPCVRLRNLPHEATLEDVLVFFQGLVILDVILQGNGEAFVIFANPMDFQMALQRYVYDSFSLSRLAVFLILYSSLVDQQ